MLFTEIGALRVGDLGCSSHMDEVCSMSDRRYMALEGLEDIVNPMRDLFSLGLVIYECMSKEELPLSGDRWLELRQGGVSIIEYLLCRLGQLMVIQRNLIR